MSTELELPFRPDNQLTEVMRLRVQSLQQRGQKRQDGERLLLPNEVVYRLDFSKQSLRFSRWTVCLAQAGRLTITATSQLWTPDLTNLMTRQLLEPVGAFWRAPGGASDAPVQCYEADAHEFGERIAELAKGQQMTDAEENAFNVTSSDIQLGQEYTIHPSFSSCATELVIQKNINNLLLLLNLLITNGVCIL